jgi:hypothetical protein
MSVVSDTRLEARKECPATDSALTLKSKVGRLKQNFTTSIPDYTHTWSKVIPFPLQDLQLYRVARDAAAVAPQR